MANLFLVNNSQQDFTVPVIVEGKRKSVMVPRDGTMLLLDAHPTPELEAVHRSKNMNFTYQVRD